MTYSIRILSQDKVRLDWLLANDEGSDEPYTLALKRDIADLDISIRSLESSEENDFKSSLPNDEEIEKRAEYMQKPRNPKNDNKEEFIYGYMQGAEWIINQIQ